MKKLTYLLFLAMGVTACSVESLDSTENLLTADLKVKMQLVEKSMNLKYSEICEGEAPVFVFNFPQDAKGNGDPKDTDIQIQLYNPISGEWEQFKKLSYAGAGPEEFTYTDAILEIDTYDFRVSIGSGGYDYFTTLNVVDCSECEESFSYVDNKDGSYTFTYIPEDDMENAEVVFTIPQGVVISGYEWDWNGTSSSRTELIDLEACEKYTWTVGLDTDCRGKGQKEVNLWTDFKVEGVSKKNELTPNIEKSCGE